MKMFAKLMEDLQSTQAHAQAAQMQRPSATNVYVPQPSPLALEGDMQENLDFFEQSWKDYAKAIGMHRWPVEENPQKVNFLLSVIGEPARRKYFNFELTTDERADPETALAAIREKVVAKRNVLVDRLDFFSVVQLENESIDDFVSRLKMLAKTSKLGTLQTELIVFKVATSNKWPHLRTKMLAIRDITLANAIDMCRAEEITVKRSQELEMLNIRANRFAEVNKVAKYVTRSKSHPKRCKFCGDFHIFSKGSCPALGKRCKKCRGRNHFEKVCKMNRSSQYRKRDRKGMQNDFSGTEESSVSSDDSEDEYAIGKINDSSKENGVLVELDFKCNNKWRSVVCDVDTGANTSLIGHNWLTELTAEKNPQLLPSNVRLKSFGGNPIKVLGQVKIPCHRMGQIYKLVLQVVDVDHRPLLSAKASRVLGLVKFSKQVTYGSKPGRSQIA